MTVSRRHLVQGLALAGTLQGMPLGAQDGQARTRRTYLRGRHGQVHCRSAQPAGTSANGPPLLLLHGFPASGAQFTRLLPPLARDRRCIAPDLPGFGDSDPPATQPAVDDYALAAGEVLDALAPEPVDLLGFHSGCAVAVALALQRPSQIRRLVLIASPPAATAAGSDPAGTPGPMALTRDGSHLVSAWQQHLAAGAPGWPLEWAAEQFVDVIRRPAIAWWGLDAVRHHDAESGVARLALPVLVLEGWTTASLDLRAGELARAVGGFLGEPG
jgi:pimeloyl-ACP methyl ester carboxylesterase